MLDGSGHALRGADLLFRTDSVYLHIVVFLVGRTV